MEVAATRYGYATYNYLPTISLSLYHKIDLRFLCVDTQLSLKNTKTFKITIESGYQAHIVI